MMPAARAVWVYKGDVFYAWAGGIAIDLIPTIFVILLDARAIPRGGGGTRTPGARGGASRPGPEDGGPRRHLAGSDRALTCAPSCPARAHWCMPAPEAYTPYQRART